MFRSRVGRDTQANARATGSPSISITMTNRNAHIGISSPGKVAIDYLYGYPRHDGIDDRYRYDRYSASVRRRTRAIRKGLNVWLWHLGCAKSRYLIRVSLNTYLVISLMEKRIGAKAISETKLLKNDQIRKDFGRLL